jgi:DNA-directed RNA polymerase specialized sigma24 family protein
MRHQPGRTRDRSWPDVTGQEFAGALAALPADLRAVFQLQAFEGHSYDRIATLLRIPRDTVGTRLRGARRLLGAALTPREE